MKNRLLIIVLFLAGISCDDDQDSYPRPDALVGFWRLETVYLNGVNSNEYVDFLNGGNYLNINKDKTFDRAYVLGTWVLANKTLKLKPLPISSLRDRTYEIVEYDADNLILETKLTEGEYCCDFDFFAADQVIAIREVYKR